MSESPVKRLRKSKELTQGELSLLLDVTPLYVWKWEKGHVRPSERRLRQLADLFGLELEELRDEIEDHLAATKRELLIKLKGDLVN